MRSDPFVVRFSQLGELNSSLGASEPKCTLEDIYFTHIGSLGKVIEYLGGRGTSQLHRVQPSSSKVEHLCKSCELQIERQRCESVQFDPLSISMGITIFPR